MNNRKWTKEEEDILMNGWGTLKISTLSERLGRTEGAIASKAKRMMLGTQMQWYGASEVAEMLGMSRRNVLLCMEQGKLKTKRDKTKKKRYVATEEDIRKFMRDYQNLWDTRKVTINIFDNKPKWLVEKEIEDKKRSIKTWDRWTDLEVKILVDRFRRGYTFDEIGKELSRSRNAIKNKIVNVEYGKNIRL